MTAVLFKNARIFDGINADCPEGMEVLVEGATIREVSSKPVKAKDVCVIDVGGRMLMPGLIDAHVHAYFCHVDWHKMDLSGQAYRTAHAARMLGFALHWLAALERLVAAKGLSSPAELDHYRLGLRNCAEHRSKRDDRDLRIRWG